MSKSNIIGWSVTLFLSIVGAYTAMNARVYEVEARIRLLELQQTMNLTRLEKSDANYEQIKESLSRIENVLVQKQDKKYIE